jgi:hypothetical protein
MCLREQGLLDKVALMKAISALLTPSTEVGLRKNASSCMGAFAVVLSA